MSVLSFSKNFRWSHHKILEDAYDADIDVWGWGARTTWEEFPEKSRIINKLEDRIVHVLGVFIIFIR